ncbi:hypothetical protein [Leptospira sp. 'Mane']|uniref:hypothetical protein n=1 Tax=Leptospira sp. 'Mane' TaxID=3387407 RepID=UPI00398B8706
MFEPKINTVPDAFVQDRLLNEDQKNSIHVLNDNVVQLKNDVVAQKKANEVTTQTIQISKKKIINHISKTDLLKDKEKLALIKEDNETAKRYLNEVKISESEKADEEIRLKTWTQKVKEDNAYYQLLEAKLSEKIAELELMRAGIAVTFQESAGKSPKEKDFITKEKFNTQHTKTIADTRKKQSEWDRVKTETLKLPKVNLDKTYTDDKV